MIETVIKLLVTLTIILISFLAQNYWFNYMVLDKYFDDEERTTKIQYTWYKNLMIIAWGMTQLLGCFLIFKLNFVMNTVPNATVWGSILIQITLIYLFIYLYNKYMVYTSVLLFSLENIRKFFYEEHHIGMVFLYFAIVIGILGLGVYFNNNKVKWARRKYNFIFSMLFTLFCILLFMISNGYIFQKNIPLVVSFNWLCCWLLSSLLFMINRVIASHILEYNRRIKNASVDALTKIANRGSFEKNLEKSFEFYKKVNTPYSLAIFDIDHFKKVNDTWGHLAGDEVLRMVSDIAEKVLLKHFKNSKIYRVGGEEFVIAFRGKAAIEALPVLREISTKIEAMVINYEGAKIQVTISSGLVEMTKNCKSSKELYDRADKNMYYSKHNGRNKISFEGKLM